MHFFALWGAAEFYPYISLIFKGKIQITARLSNRPSACWATGKNAENQMVQFTNYSTR